MTDLADLTLSEAAAALRAGEISAVELTQASLVRVTARNPRLAAFTHVNDRAMDEAAHAQAMIAAGTGGPLCGIPLGIKDLIDVADQPATCGSAVFGTRIASEDAAAVALLRAQGVVMLGKVATYEFAMVGPDLTLPHPPARNPWNPDHITGGSSSGSAAAVAGGMVRAALGTDTGGSVRSPAAYCGCVGLKPSFGRTSKAGAFPLSPSLDHVGPLAATVAEAALVLDAISLPGWRPASALLGQGVRGLTIGFARDWHASDPACAPAVLRALDDAAATLSMLGARITLLPLPDYSLYEDAASLILHHEALEVHRPLMQDHAALYGRPVLQCLAFGAAVDPEDLARAQQAKARLTAAMDQAMAGVDLMLTAATLTTALPFSAFDGEKAVWTPMRTIPFNLTGQPAITLPAGFDQGLPLSLQLAARIGDEDRLCAAAQAFEQATDHAIRPSFSV